MKRFFKWLWMRVRGYRRIRLEIKHGIGKGQIRLGWIKDNYAVMDTSWDIPPGSGSQYVVERK